MIGTGKEETELGRTWLRALSRRLRPRNANNKNADPVTYPFLLRFLRPRPCCQLAAVYAVCRQPNLIKTTKHKTHAVFAVCAFFIRFIGDTVVANFCFSLSKARWNLLARWGGRVLHPTDPPFCRHLPAKRRPYLAGTGCTPVG